MIGQEGPSLRATLMRWKSSLIAVGLLSACINVMVLGGPIYMMLIYDSVMPSGSLATLFGLLAMVTFIFIFHGILDGLRNRILGDVAGGLDETMAVQIHRLISAQSLNGIDSAGDGLTPMRDLDAVRKFIASPGPSAFFDLPWVLLFIGLLTLLHFWLGITALVGAVILVLMAMLNNRLTRSANQASFQVQAVRAQLAQESRRHAEAVRSLGMGTRMEERWHRANADYTRLGDRTNSITSMLSSSSRTFRMFLQSAVLTVGALLYLAGEASGGIIFAASILAARALAPIDLAISQWAPFAAARQGWYRLEESLDEAGAPRNVTTKLPPPNASLAVEQITVHPPGGRQIVLEGVSFELSASDALGVIGPSASGKTSLVRTLIGVWEPLSGAVRLDGAKLDQWTPETLGGHLGYLPQKVELLDGTIAENIARFEPDAPSQEVIAAAKAAGVHELILRSELGYQTPVRADGSKFSAGQRQRIALARAIYRNPFLIVLDEPNSNLDGDGEAALDRAIEAARVRGAIVVIVAHRPAALRHANKVLVLKDGRMIGFGPRDEILSKYVAAVPDLGDRKPNASGVTDLDRQTQ